MYDVRLSQGDRTRRAIATRSFGGLAHGPVDVSVRRRGLAVAAAALAFGVRSDRANAQTASVQLPAAKAAALVAATSASATEFRAVGEQAQLINASLPFSASPLQASNPFDLSEQHLRLRGLLKAQRFGDQQLGQHFLIRTSCNLHKAAKLAI